MCFRHQRLHIQLVGVRLADCFHMMEYSLYVNSNVAGQDHTSLESESLSANPKYLHSSKNVVANDFVTDPQRISSIEIETTFAHDRLPMGDLTQKKL